MRAPERGPARGRPERTLAVAGTALLAAATWLCLPRARGASPEPPLLVAAVDASASVTRQRPAWSGWARDELATLAQRAVAERARLAVIELADDVVLVFGPGDPAEFAERLAGAGGEPYLPGARVAADDLASRLAAALELVDELARGRAGAEVVVLGDGVPVGGDARPVLARLAAEGVALRLREPPPPARGDLALRGVRVPSRVEAGAPLPVAVALAFRPGSAGGEQLALVVGVEGPGPSVERRVALRVPADPPGEDGWQRWTERVELPGREPGLQRVRARARLVRGGVDADPAPENDAASTLVRVRGAALVARVASPAARAALAGFRPPGIEWLDVEPGELAPALLWADALWTVDAPLALLPADALERFVRAGGGWLACAGWGALPGWSADARPADLLPLEPDDGDLPERDVVLLVDGSGSMAGEPFERVREATLALVLAGQPRDRFRLRFFTGTLGPVVFEAGGEDVEERRRELAPLLAARVPRGPTDVLFALERLAQQRAGAERAGLAFLISDGRTEGWTPELSRAARERLAASGTDLRVLAVGARADRAFLESLLLAGETLVEVRDLEELEEELQREVNVERTRDGGLRPARLVAADALAPGSVGRELVDAQRTAEGEELGPLGRYVAATLGPGAQLLWRAPEGEPLLALGRVGRGLVAACATAPVPGWGVFLGERPVRLEPLLRALARGRQDDGGPPRAMLEGDELRLEDVPEDWPARVEARIVEARAPSFAEPVRGALLARAKLDPPFGGADPDAPRRRVAPRPDGLAGAPGGAPWRVELAGPGGALADLPLEVGPPAELDAAPRPALVAAPVRAVPSGPPTRPCAPHPAAPAVLAAGALALGLSALLPALRGQGTGGSGRR